MKYVAYRFIFVLVGALFMASCSNDPSTPFSFYPDQSTPAYPTKNIHVTEGGINSPYTALGPVEYTLTSNFPAFSDPPTLRYQAIENLKQAAVARFGPRVDAIINVQLQENLEQSGYFSPATIYARGIAIAYKDGTKPYSKSKRKHKVKSSKSSAGKAKSSDKSPRKPAPDEQDDPQITPSEMLK